MEGHFIRRVYDFKLIRRQNPIFFLTWTVMHLIDEQSPLYQATPETLAAEEASLIVILTGIDETVSQMVHARHSYSALDILWNMRFVDILLQMSNKQRCVDYSRFHDVMPL